VLQFNFCRDSMNGVIRKNDLGVLPLMTLTLGQGCTKSNTLVLGYGQPFCKIS